MKNFKKLMDSALQQTELKRVRIKSDPANVQNGEITKFCGYVGYILAEVKSLFRKFRRWCYCYNSKWNDRIHETRK